MLKTNSLRKKLGNLGFFFMFENTITFGPRLWWGLYVVHKLDKRIIFGHNPPPPTPSSTDDERPLNKTRDSKADVGINHLECTIVYLSLSKHNYMLVLHAISKYLTYLTHLNNTTKKD